MRKAVKLLARSLWMRYRARRAGLPGLAIDGYGRFLALRAMVARRRVRGLAWRGLVNPVSCVRYMEFEFVSQALARHAPATDDYRVLDVSSPRLFPFWAAEKRQYRVTMINPDPSDIAQSRDLASHVRAPVGLDVAGEADATSLPFADDSFDAATSISVIEHINGDGDRLMMDEMTRVVRPGGRVVITFPVKPMFEKEFRDEKDYATQTVDVESGRYFFQRFYDQSAIGSRLLNRAGLAEEKRQYFVENPPGWFKNYEKMWKRHGLAHIVDDPWLMARHFQDAGSSHPSDRMGVCCLSLVVVKPKSDSA